jgi:hypothetical protein
MAILRRRVGSSVLPFAIVVSALLAGSAMAAIAPVRLIGGRPQQSGGYASSTWVAWTSRANSTDAQSVSNALARPIAGGTAIRLNAANTQGFTGGFDPGTNTVIYQQVDMSTRTNASDLYFYDLDTQTRTLVSGVNTKRWEWGPRISAGYILFDVDYRKNRRWRTAVDLYDRLAGTTVTLANWGVSRYYAPTGAVGERYATWTLCSTTCSAYVYDISTATTMVIPTRNGRPQYAPVVDETNGRVYFVRSGTGGCGRRVVMLRLPVADLSATPTRIVAMPDGVDIDDSMSLAPGTASDIDLLFSRIVCNTSNIDVYELRDVGSAPDAA